MTDTREQPESGLTAVNQEIVNHLMNVLIGSTVQLERNFFWTGRFHCPMRGEARTYATAKKDVLDHAYRAISAVLRDRPTEFSK